MKEKIIRIRSESTYVTNEPRTFFCGLKHEKMVRTLGAVARGDVPG
jgi:hypothetical protein